MAVGGKSVSIAILATSIAIGGGVWYAYNYAYYEDVVDAQIEMTSITSGLPETIIADNVQAIDAFSSPIRFRACFDTPMSLSMLTETYEVFDGAEPLNPPPWFTCFDATAIAKALEAGTAVAFTGQRNIKYGIDSVVVVTEDGAGFAWHQLNECGDKLYDGTPAGENCPEKEQD